ncbi:MAG: carboxypeptidase regulatory-like domain-containing protein, partial [Deltaproteobacteria bacterium]|nr:carboxypeptidase regulatory-like domain-containing protein [Deltaproteobacteria bacterium]
MRLVAHALVAVTLGACGGSGTGAEAEDSLAACTDGIDNDGDGTKDCDDDDCNVFVACLPGYQDGVVLPDGGSREEDGVPADGSRVGDATGPQEAGRADNPAGPDGTEPPPDASGGACQPCGYGSLKGRVCAPSQQVYIAGAAVTIETTDCAGKPITLTAKSNFDGVYLFESVPCGMQTVHIQKGSFEHSFEVPISTGKLTDVSGADMKMCFAASAVSIAVLWGQWDEMNDIVVRLGFAYEWFYYEDDLYSEDPDWENVDAV